jgi:hypothetical protein
MKTALAYFNWGRWVVDCPEPGCTDARSVYTQDKDTGEYVGKPHTEDVCANGHPFRIAMPPPTMEARIVTALAERDDADKSWFPRNHPLALAGGFPHGQDVDDLLAENERAAQHRAARTGERDKRLRETLATLGVEIGPDGSFSGQVT